MSQKYNLVITKSRISARNIMEQPVVIAVIEYPEFVNINTLTRNIYRPHYEGYADIKYIAMHCQADEFIRTHLADEPTDGGPYSFTKHMVPVLPQNEVPSVTEKEIEPVEIPKPIVDFTINLDDYPNEDYITFRIIKPRKV